MTLILEFWGVLPEPNWSQDQRIRLEHLTADPHDQRNWSLIALRFPDLADAVPPPMFAQKSSKETLSGQINGDVAACQKIGLGPDCSLADIAEALTGSRQYGGATYTRVKRVKEMLEVSTTTPVEEASRRLSLKKAA